MASKSAVLGVPARPTGLLAAILAMPRWSLLLLAAIAVRALTFGNPIVHVDEEFYFVTAQSMLHGGIPYVDVWDRKPIGLFLLYIPAAVFGVPGGIWLYQAMALASVVATALLLAHLADKAGWRRGALAIALLYIFMLGFGDGQGGQAPVFYNLLVAGAVALIVPREADLAEDRHRIRRGMSAMLLIGAAIQIKYSVLFEGMFLGLWLLWREYKLGVSWDHVVRRGLAYAGMAAIPTLIAGAAYYGLGHFNDWMYANFGSILDRLSDPGAVLLKAFAKVALILGPLLIVCGLSSRLRIERESERPVRILLFGWLIASVIGLLAFGSWFNHYALPVMAPATLCCAGFLGETRLGRNWFKPAMLLMAASGGTYTAYSAMWHRGNGAQLEELTELIGKGPGCMYVYSGNVMLYGATGRCALTPWIFPSHLSRERENGAVGVDQGAEIRRIFAKRPEIVVMRPEYGGERAAMRALVKAELAAGGYALRGRAPLGDLIIDVYALPTATSAASPPPRLAAKRPP